jgi:hypothetical protein
LTINSILAARNGGLPERYAPPQQKVAVSSALVMVQEKTF